MEDTSFELCVTVAEKKVIFGRKFRIQVGSNTDGGTPERNDTDIEQVCFNSMPEMFYDDILHKFFATNVFDMTVGNVVLAQHCVTLGVNYFGICWSTRHAELARDIVAMAALKAKCTEGNIHFNAKCAKVMELANYPASGK